MKMGVRLVMFDKAFAAINGTNVPDPADHNLLINRDMKNQHPIWAISGLQDVLNELEDLIRDTNTLVLQIQEWCKDKIAEWEKELADLTEYVMNIKTLEHVVDTDTIDMHYDNDTKTLSADVLVFPDEHNAVQALYGGIFVPKVMTEDTNTVRWQEESSGETLEEIWNHGERFSHSYTWSDTCYPREMSEWYWDTSLQSFVQPLNTLSYNGFITEKKYDRYVHRVTIQSNDNDDDSNGVVVAHVKDGSGNPHTLSVIVTRGGQNSARSYSLVYDYGLPDEYCIADRGTGIGGTIPGGGSGGWSGKNITIEVTKEDNIVTTACSNWNQTAINEGTRISIDLNNYSWGHLFLGKVKYGYSNMSQAKSYFKNVYFKSREISEYNIFRAYVKISEEKNNAIKEKDDGIWAETFITSKESGNILQKKSDGWYVPDLMLISKESGNIIQKKSDGIYAADPVHVIRKEVTQANHGFAVGDFIYYDHRNGYQKALALDDYTINIVGIVAFVKDANTFEYQWSGFFATTLFNSLSGFVQGMPVYISEVDAGKVVQKQPDVSKAVGYPVEDAGIIISIERGIQYNMESQLGDFKNCTTQYNVRSDGFIKVHEGIDYKATMVRSLLDVLDDTFKTAYMKYDNAKDTYQFINTEVLRIAQSTPEGMNLFIKAF